MEKFFREKFTFDKTARTLFYILLIVILVCIIKTIWAVLLPFILAGIFAYVFLPFVKFIQYKLKVKYRVVSVFIVFAIVVSLISIAITFLVPSVQDEINKTMEVLSSYNSSNSAWDIFLPERVRNFFSNFNLVKELRETLTTEKVVNGVKELLGEVQGIVNGAISAFSWGLVFVIGIVYFVFILIDFEKLVNGFIGLIPQSFRNTSKEILKETDYHMNSYFRGQGLIALSVAILLSIAFNIIGLPMATAIGIFIGILNFIPYMQIFGLIPLGLMCILMSIQKDQNVFFSFLLGYGIMAIVQILQDTVITPSVMGKSMGMRPSLILFSISVWGYLLGFFGMLIALPLSMTIYSIYMKYILKDSDYIKEQASELQLETDSKKKKR